MKKTTLIQSPSRQARMRLTPALLAIATAILTTTSAHAGFGSLLKKGMDLLSGAAEVVDDAKSIADGIKGVADSVNGIGGGGGGSGGGGGGGSISIIGVGDVTQEIDMEQFDNNGDAGINSISINGSAIGKLTVQQKFGVKKLLVETDAKFSANSLILDGTRLLALDVEQTAEGDDWQMRSGSKTVVNLADFTGLSGAVFHLRQHAKLGRFVNKGTAALNVFTTQANK